MAKNFGQSTGKFIQEATSLNSGKDVAPGINVQKLTKVALRLFWRGPFYLLSHHMDWVGSEKVQKLC